MIHEQIAYFNSWGKQPIYKVLANSFKPDK